MAQAKTIAMGEAITADRIPEGVSIKDAVTLSTDRVTGLRYSTLLISAIAGAGASTLMPVADGSLLMLLCALAFAGGLLSTWSPCGYSSLSTLRIDPPQDLGAMMRWMPTLVAHGLGYAAGGLLLAAALAAIGWLLPVHSLGPWSLAVLASVALLYGLHQLRIIRMPYPQLRLQVSHGARMDLPKWTTGFLYGGHLGLNFATYIRSPILYIVVLASVLSGSLMTTLAIVFSLNLGRFLPLLAVLLPVADPTIQRWMAERERAAIVADGSTLVFVGALLMAAVMAQVL